MKASASFRAGSENDSWEVLWEDAGRVFCRLRREDAAGERYAFIPVISGGEHPAVESIKRLEHEYELRDYLDRAWALQPVELVRERAQTMLIVEYGGGEPLDRIIGQPMEIGRFLRLALALAVAIGRLHARGLIHKDIKPANVIVETATGRVWLTGFGTTSRQPRERQSPEPPEFIAGTLAYMAPEQTGRMNRSIDSRSDLYSLGITFYEMLTGNLPFTASNPMEWIHCHIARQPVSPGERVKHIPTAVSAITMKLLSKTAEERYQTAAGLESDLRQCLSEGDAQAAIGEFLPGKNDTPDRLLIPEKLYGRDREVEVLLSAFDRIASGGRPELVLVSGYSGIGKSAVVNELHKSLVPARGLFASGKFDQYKRDIPYCTLAQAFRSLVRPFLSKSEEDLRKWRETLSGALDPNGMLMIELVPELRHVIGEQPPAPELSPQDAQRRFQLVFRRFIGVFARPEHPLALFFDDLQWLDEATLEFLEDLLPRPEMRYLLLIGAYRDNEVDPGHPLVRKLDEIRAAGGILKDVILAPLGREDLGHLLADSLHCDSGRVSQLAQLIHEKTTGNPFFAIQFISTLADERLLKFDYEQGRWSWELNRIRAKNYADNVAELMVGKLTILPLQTQEALQQLACMGNSAEFHMLQRVFRVSLDELDLCLWEAVRAGLVSRSRAAYRFVHDRVQEAAYSSIAEERRADVHLRIGMLLIEHTPPEELEDWIFEIVNQLNRASYLIISRHDRERVAALNLMAGRRARNSAAYASAIQYLRAGSALLGEETWKCDYELLFSIECLMAECEVLTAETVVAEERLSMLARRAKDRHDFCLVTRLRLTLYMTLDRYSRAVEVFLEWLRRDGTTWSRHPTRDDVMHEYARIGTLLEGRQIEELVNLPVITDRDILDTVDVFTEIVTPSWVYDEQLTSLVVCRLVNVSLEYGNWDGSCFAYAWLGILAGPRFGSYPDGFRFGQLAYDLAERGGPTRYQARTYMSVGALIMPWQKHPAIGRELVRRVFDAAYRIGDLTFAAYSWHQSITLGLAVGDPLGEAQTQAQNGLAFAKTTRFGLLIDICAVQVGLIRTLRGMTLSFGHFDDEEFSEPEFERHLAANKNLALAEFFYWTRKLQARFFAGDHASAIDASMRARSLPWLSSGMFETAELRFYSALAHARAWDSGSPEQRRHHLEALKTHQAQIEAWAEQNSVTFENRAALIAAELARVEGRTLVAEELYEKAIRSAHAHGFVHHEAVASEVAGRFYAARGFEKIARTYLREARHCYLRWGADGKVRQLEQLYPHLGAESPVLDVTTTIFAPVEHLDVATVIKVSEAVSGEIVLEKLIDTLMRKAIEHAGADRGLLILDRGGDYLIEAEVTSRGEKIAVDQGRQRVTAGELPESVLRYVHRTKEYVLLNDASGENAFAADEYLCKHYTRSLLCLPILKQNRLLGMLYLENRLTRHAFTPGRVAILKLLASEAAISIENASLYRDLAQREAKIGRLVDANIIGIFFWTLQGRILEANDAFLLMVGYGREDLVSGRLDWRRLTPPEWVALDEQQLEPQLKMTGRLVPFEKEFFRKDGSRVPVLAGVAAFEEGGDEGVAFVLDLTERKRAAEALRELQMELTHANRLATLGQLAASVAHEVNQPIGAAHNNARAALRFLAVEPPELGEVAEALECVVKETYQAGDIIGRIRDQIKKAAPRREGVDLNEAIEDVIALVRGELSKHRVSLRRELAAELPLVTADRVQLQQVILNLILNAIEAMMNVEAEARELLISTASQPGVGVLVAVGDSGPGVDAAYRERIFESFYTTKAGGLGIGLSICRSIVDVHGGRLWVEEHQPRGALFRFTIPARE